MFIDYNSDGAIVYSDIIDIADRRYRETLAGCQFGHGQPDIMVFSE